MLLGAEKAQEEIGSVCVDGDRCATIENPVGVSGLKSGVGNRGAQGDDTHMS